MSVLIRSCQESDLSKIRSLVLSDFSYVDNSDTEGLEILEAELSSYTQILHDYFLRESKPFSHFWCCTDLNGAVLGCVGLKYVSDKMAEIKHFHVEISHRRQKMGLKLIVILLEYAIQQSYQTVNITINNKQVECLKVIKKLGFESVSKLDKFIKCSIELDKHKDHLRTLSLGLFSKESERTSATINTRKNVKSLSLLQKSELSTKASEIKTGLVSFAERSFGGDFSYESTAGLFIDSKMAVSNLINSEVGINQLEDELSQIGLNMSFICSEYLNFYRLCFICRMESLKASLQVASSRRSYPSLD